MKKSIFTFMTVAIAATIFLGACKKSESPQSLQLETAVAKALPLTDKADIAPSTQRIDSYVGTITTSGAIKTLALNYSGPRSSDYYGEIKTTETAVGSDGRTYQFSCTHMFSSKYNGRHSPKFEWTLLANFAVNNGGTLQYLPFTFQLLPSTANEVYFIQNKNYPSVSCNETQLTYPLHSLGQSGTGIIPPTLIAQRGGQSIGTSIPMYINGDIWTACTSGVGSAHPFTKVRFEKLAVRAVHPNVTITINF